MGGGERETGTETQTGAERGEVGEEPAGEQERERARTLPKSKTPRASREIRWATRGVVSWIEAR